MTGDGFGGSEFVELSDAIEVVREQLIVAQEAGRASGAASLLNFEVGKVSVEFTGEITRTVGGSGGIKFWVLTAEGKAERASAASQKVTVELVPHSPDGSSYRIADSVNAPPSR